MLTGRWFVEHDQRFCVTRAPVFVDEPVNTLMSARVACPYIRRDPPRYAESGVQWEV